MLLLNLLKAHWRGAAVLALLCLAFAFGRHSRPPKVVTQWRERVVTQVVEKKAKTETKTVVVYRDRIVHKDGSSEEKTKEVETDGSAETDNLESVKTVQQNASQSVKTAPLWHVSAGLGVPVQLRAPFVGTPFLMVDVSRQVWGPLELGLWGTLDVTGKNPALGVAVGLSF